MNATKTVVASLFSVQRLPNGSGGARDTTAFSAALPTPGITNDVPDTEAPTVPLNVMATNKTATSISLTWEASSDNIGVTGYKIYQDNTVIGTSQTVNFVATSLMPQTTYNFTVTALDAAGNESAVSNTLTEQTLEQTIISIAEARTQSLGTQVIVKGVVTVSSQFGGPAFIQDETAGIAVFDSQLHGDGNYAIGDNVTINATLDAFNDQIQLSNITSITKADTPKTITPKLITLAELEANRGQLVKINTVSFPNPNSAFSGNTNYTISDASGTAQLRIDRDTEDIVNTNQPSTCNTLIGVVGHFQGTNQILPRSITDFACDSPIVVEILINEIDADNAGTDTTEFIELYDGGLGNSSLDGYIVVLFNGSNSESYDTIDLNGFSTTATGYFVIGSSTVPNVNLEAFTSNGLQNGEDVVALYKANATDFPNGTTATDTNLIDAIVYETNDSSTV